MLTVKEHWKGRNSYTVHGDGVDVVVRCRALPDGRYYITIQGKGQRTQRLDIEEAVLKFKAAGKKNNGASILNQIPDEREIQLANVYFVDEEHERNFAKIAAKFPDANKYSEYRAACYVAAHPDIFKCFNLQKQVHGPFDWYFESMNDDYIERRDSGETSGDTAPLTGSTRRLVDLGVNLWNGKHFDLTDGLSMWDNEMYMMAIQAIDLRRSRPIFNLQALGGPSE